MILFNSFRGLVAGITAATWGGSDRVPADGVPSPDTLFSSGEVVFFTASFLSAPSSRLYILPFPVSSQSILISGKALAILTRRSYPGLFLPFNKWDIADGLASISVANLVAVNPFCSIMAFNLSFISSVNMSACLYTCK